MEISPADPESVKLTQREEQRGKKTGFSHPIAETYIQPWKEQRHQMRQTLVPKDG